MQQTVQLLEEAVRVATFLSNPLRYDWVPLHDNMDAHQTLILTHKAKNAQTDTHTCMGEWT